jgi:hypothetical protein
MIDPNEFAKRYAALWNQPDATERRRAIEAMWGPSGVHFTPSIAAMDIDAIDQRISSAHKKWVAEEGCTFASANNAQHHHGGLRFNWHMMRGEKIVSIGFDFILLDETDRILSDHQFVDANPG